MQHWQDIVLSIGSLILAAALLPSVLHKDKPALSTSLMTGSVLLVFTVTYSSLGLWYATATTFLTGLLWLILALQKISQSRKLHKS